MTVCQQYIFASQFMNFNVCHHLNRKIMCKCQDISDILIIKRQLLSLTHGWAKSESYKCSDPVCLWAYCQQYEDIKSLRWGCALILFSLVKMDNPHDILHFTWTMWLMLRSWNKHHSSEAKVSPWLVYSKVKKNQTKVRLRLFLKLALGLSGVFNYIFVN